MPELSSPLHFGFARRTGFIRSIVLRHFLDHSVTYLFNRTLDNIADGYHFPSLAKSINAIKGLFFRHWVPLGFKKVNTASGSEVQPNFELVIDSSVYGKSNLSWRLTQRQHSRLKPATPYKMGRYEKIESPVFYAEETFLRRSSER
jgi:hypothetical protein